ncbi:type IV pilus assembly protein PilM [Planctomycetota bacterium]
MAKKQKLIGLDIGTNEVRVVEVSTTPDDVVITGFGYAAVEDPTKKKDAISAALARGGIKTKRAVTAVSGRMVPVRYVTMPRMPEDKLREAIMVEANKYIPFDVDEAVIDCEMLAEEPVAEGEPQPSEVAVRLAAVKRDIIEEHVADLGGAGVYPIIVDHDCFALGNAFEFRELYKAESEREKRVIALVDVGGEKTSINVMQGLDSFFTREVPGGGVSLTDAVARRLSISNDDAEELKKNPGENAEEVMEAVLGPLDDLMSEISLSFDYFENQHEKMVEEVLISGGTSQLSGIMEVFQQHFGKPTNFWDPLEGLQLELPAHQLGQLKSHARTVPVALGLAARVKTQS